MEKTLPPEQTAASGDGAPLRMSETLRNWLHKSKLRQSSLWPAIERFGSWVEFEGARLAREAHESKLRLKPIGATDELRLYIGQKTYPHELNQFQKLWAFLAGLGVREIEVDGRLERNQIEDVLAFIHLHREDLSQCAAGRDGGSICTDLCGTGIHIACTCTRVCDGILEIRYSYCQLRLSRLVRWFEQRQKDFRDHRALFYAAPRYAMLVGLISLGPSMLVALIQNEWTLLGIMLIESLVLMALVYLFFMVVGSVEYDNEEKAYQLTKAYGRLKTTTEHIQADVKRARVVQEKFLPDLQMMPCADQLEWAGFFAPAEEVGGDYFDVHQLDDRRVAVLFSDVSGHGMAAAFITAILKTTFKAGMESGDAIAELLRKINTSLYRLTHVGSFAAVWMGILDVKTGELEYANGGHHPLPVWIKNGPTRQVMVVDGARNLLLGVEEDITFQVARQNLSAGDIMLWSSDGVVEMRDNHGRQFGPEALHQLLAQHENGAVDRLVTTLIDKLDAFANGRAPDDDRTILALRYKGGWKDTSDTYDI